MASVRSIDDALGITLDNNGRLIRNIIHGADTVMSHILHFYHLAAVDFIDASALGSPWNPAFGTLSDAKMLPVAAKNLSNDYIALNYVQALNIRRDAHTLSAMFSGRHPISNAIVPGGAASIVTSTDIANAKPIINKIRNFINCCYVTDVVTAAVATSYGFHNYWNVGTSPGRVLSYGEYPFENAPFKNVTNLLLARGVSDIALTPPTFDVEQITERVNFSYYSSADNLKPSVGETTPDITLMGATTDHYSWLKAPRYGGNPHEVGPLARMLVSYLTATTGGKAAGSPGRPQVNASGTGVDAGTLGIAGNYTVDQLVDGAVTALNGILGAGTVGYANLFSPLGRHACRMLECKFIADALGGGVNGGNSWLDALTTVVATDGGNQVAYGYNYVKIPKSTVYGTGLAEAPRGALGHWMEISNKKIARYQCVVPSTWNCGPRSSGTVLGVAESALIGVPAAVGGSANDAILNVARMLHPYDFCIACAVHIVNPEGKEIAKFTMDTDGKITKFPVDSE